MSTVKNTLRSAYYAALPHCYQAKSLVVNGCLPDFLIVGVQKGGTTSLYNYLLQHPDVVSASRKEIHYFDKNYHRGERWYQSHFVKANKVKRKNSNSLTGECTPYYAYNPYIPERLAKLIPSAKIVFILRNPTDRAVSHYKHNVNRGKYDRKISLSDALDFEEKHLEHEIEALSPTRSGYGANHDIYSLMDRGKYADQIRRYQQYFPKNNILVLTAEELFDSPNQVLAVLCQFLGLSPYDFSVEKIYNQNPQKIDVENESVERLRLYFKNCNHDLERLLERKLNW